MSRRNEYDYEWDLDVIEDMIEAQEEFLLNKFGIEDEAEFEPMMRTKPHEDKPHRSARQNRKDKRFRELRRTMREV